MPEGIQRRRIKGYRLPPNTVCVTRPGLTEMLKAMRGEGGLIPIAGSDFSRVIDDPEAHFRRMAERLHELVGKNLACYCPLDKPCHRNILLALANSPPSE